MWRLACLHGEYTHYGGHNRILLDDADDQAGHGESHEQNGGEEDGQDKEEVVDLTTCAMNTILFCFALLVSFVLFSVSFLDIQEGEGLFCSVLFPCVFFGGGGFFQEFSGVLL